ncbi:MAG TPA: hypothetical protein VMR76_00095 [Candidatus Saccharimonadia bacterium]|nr:hypothetical protein [Candidatus Saccharimonadia bacterium]
MDKQENLAEKLPLKRMTTPTAKELEALISMHQDYRYVMQLSHAAVQLIEAGVSDDDQVLLQTYWSAALNAYARPFKDGVRQLKMKPDIFTRIDGATESHDYFMNQRDKLIAHSVNPFEEVYVGVFVDADCKVVGVGELSGRLVATSLEGFRDLNQLAKIATEHLMDEITKCKAELLKKASAMTCDELEKLAEVKFTVPSPEQSKDSR